MIPDGGTGSQGGNVPTSENGAPVAGGGGSGAGNNEPTSGSAIFVPAWGILSVNSVVFVLLSVWL